MSKSGSLSSVVKGNLKFDGKAECFEDWREHVYINISNAMGYEGVRKILHGEDARDLSPCNSCTNK